MIKCSNCGRNISDYAVVCPNCGYKTSSKSNNEAKHKGTKSLLQVKAKTKITLAVTFTILIISTFIFACALNAYNAIIGKSVLGLGSIFFERIVINCTMKPVVIVEVCTGVISLACIVVIVSCFVTHFRNRNKKLDK